MYRVAFSPVMLGLAGRHENRPVKRQRDEPMTDTVLLFLLVSVLAREHTLIPRSPADGWIGDAGGAKVAKTISLRRLRPALMFGIALPRNRY
jgi:hypothetical protein